MPRCYPLVLLGILPLAAATAPHPRLYLNPQRIAALRAGFRTTYAEAWAPVQKRADAIATTHPPAYVESRDTSGDAQNWEMGAGSNLPFLALAYGVTGQKRYFDAAKEWTLAACAYPHWGKGRVDGGDLSAGFLLNGVAVVYDWLYEELDAQSRATLRQTLIDRSRLMLAQSRKQYWREHYLQNHMWVSMAGLAAGGFALLDDAEVGAEAKTWVDASLAKFRRTETLLGPDGASHEGLNYYSLGIDGMLRFWAMAKDILGEDLTSPWWKQTGYYRLYLSLPRNSWTLQNKVVDFADCIRQDWVGPDYLMRRVAAMNHDGYIQWLARELTPVSAYERFGSGWLNPIWFDPSVAPKAPSTLPTMRWFDDIGIVSARSDWSGDESLVAFKCGPALGKYATALLDYDAGAAHVHPDANHFVVFANGEWLIRDDGYRFKVTNHHNTLLIDGKGQMGETGSALGDSWFSATEQVKLKSNPHIKTAISKPQFDFIVGDATEAYASDTGLRRFVRQVVFLKPDVLIVADDIEADRPRDLELRFHPQFPAEADQQGGWLSRGKKAALRVTPLTTDGVEVTAGYLPAKDMLRPAKAEGLDKLEDPLKFYTIRLQAKKQAWRNVVALSWGDQPVLCKLETKDESVEVQAGARHIRLNWNEAEPQTTAH